MAQSSGTVGKMNFDAGSHIATCGFGSLGWPQKALGKHFMCPVS